MPLDSSVGPVEDDVLPSQLDASQADAQPFGGGGEPDLDVTVLPLAQLREIRRILTERESRVSYWRRIIQARLDLLRDGAVKRGASVEGLQRILSQQMGANSRKGMLSVQPPGGQPIAGLNHLWNRGINGADDEQLELELVAAERELSAERSRLFGLIDAATAELIARYHVEPTLALSALPQRKVRPSPL